MQVPNKYVEPATMSPPPQKPSQAPKLGESTASMLTDAEK